MPRKPFELFSFMVHGVPSQDMVMVEEANAAIAQDREYALRRIREENHEGMIYYRERDQARAERDALREEVATHQREIERLESIVARGNHTCHKDCALDGCVNRRLSEENERLKYELEALDGLANEKHDKLSAQLAEAEKVLSGCTSANCRVRQHAKGGYGTANVCQCPEKAREFLAKAKP